MVRGNCAALCALAVLVGFGNAARAQDAAMIFVGDGLTMIIKQYDPDRGVASGELRLNGQVYPFTATLRETDAGQTAAGQFVANGQAVAFQVREDPDNEVMIFTTGNQRFRLKEVDELPPGPAPQPVPQPPAPQPPMQPPQPPQPPAPPPVQPQQPNPPPSNPLESVTPAQPAPAQPTNPLENVTPAQPSTSAQPQPSNPLESVAAPAQPAARPDKAKFTLHKFPDVSMGGVTSHTALLPEGWTAEGRTEWSTGDVPFPAQLFRIHSPGKGRYSTSGAYHSLFSRTKPQPGLPNLPDVGEMPPKSAGEWLLAFCAKKPSLKNVRLIEEHRDQKIEAINEQIARETNSARPGERREIWIVTIEYDEDGTHLRDESIHTLYVSAPMDNGNSVSQLWSVYPTSYVAAPVDQFEKLKPQLYAVGSTVRPTAKWFVQSQALLAELSRQRIANAAKVIAERAKMYDQISDAQVNAFRQRMKSMDKQQHEFTNNYLYERDDYKDTDGSIVNLPMHYQHVFSNGQGGYLLTNNSLDKPGENWQEIPVAPGIAGGG